MGIENEERPADLAIKPVVGITVGDPAGVGPEIVLKAAADPSVKSAVRPVLIGDLAFLQRTAKSLDLPVGLRTMDPAGPTEAVEVYDLANIRSDIEPGIESAAAGRAAGEYITTAVDLWRGGTIDAIATAPINKASLQQGGYDFPGHTEFLAELTDTRVFAMSFFAERLRVVLLSTHVSLRSAIDMVRTDALVDLITFTDRELSRLLGRPVKIAVAGLNPHASEGGRFGGEEAAEIEPAVTKARAAGVNVSGPYSPDTIFLRGYKGEFDVVVACYHDQATIAVKSLSFGSSVNVTLGLPLIRTSVDHGTAFDIAGKGIAEESSMKAAIRLAGALFSARSTVATSNS